VTLSPKKTTIGFLEGNMVGYIVSKNVVAIDLEKLDRISKLRIPTIKKTLQRFLGMVGYYQRFIHMFMAKTRPSRPFLH
jgi:hypothetical protein